MTDDTAGPRRVAAAGLLVLCGAAAVQGSPRLPDVLSLSHAAAPPGYGVISVLALPALLALAWHLATHAPADHGRSRVVGALWRHRSGRLGLVGCLWLVALALLVPLLTPVDPTTGLLADPGLPPSPDHWLGTDDSGRDLAARLLYGSWVSMGIGVLSAALASCLGALVGSVAGFVGGAVDRAISGLLDLLLSLPRLVLLLALATVLRPSGQEAIALVIVLLGTTSWMGVARIVRSEVLSVRSRDWVTAARALGVPEATILRRHVLPHVMAPVVVYATLAVGGAMLAEAALSYLGFGVQEPAASWGGLVRAGAGDILHTPHRALAPGLLILLAVTSVNLLGDGLRDVLDPRHGRPTGGDPSGGG